MTATSTAQCPPESVLSDFGLGKLDAASADTISPAHRNLLGLPAACGRAFGRHLYWPPAAGRRCEARPATRADVGATSIRSPTDCNTPSKKAWCIATSSPTTEGRKHTVKILDFGLAKATSEKAGETGLTKSGQMLGTPDYMAPEPAKRYQTPIEVAKALVPFFKPGQSVEFFGCARAIAALPRRRNHRGIASLRGYQTFNMLSAA